LKLLVFSDSHGKIDRMQLAAGQTHPDAILHLGDCFSDALELQRILSGVQFHMVKGNNDWQPVGENELLLTIECVTIYMTHGHHYRVKNGLHALAERARQKKANLALFGHTHQSLIRQEPGVWLMNPGQMLLHPVSYGIVTVEGGSFNCEIIRLPGMIN